MPGTRDATSWGPRALVATAVLGPLWPSTWGPSQLLVGRVLLVVLAVAVAVDLLRLRGRVARPRWAVAALALALGSLAAWTDLNAAVWGCFCSGTAQGFTELTALVLLAGAVGLYAPPRWLGAVVGAATLGVLAGGLLAAVGIKDLHAAVYAPTASVGRLDGVYGNANFLGYALASGLPAAAAGAACLRGRPRIAAAAATVVLAVLLLATYSRGSLVAAAVGVPFALWLVRGRLSVRPPRPRVVVAVALAVPVLAAALIASPLYRSHRLAADFGRDRSGAASILQDASGWTTAARGAVTASGATMSNVDGDALRVVASRPGQGVDYNAGPAFGRSRVAWSFLLSGAGGGARRVAWTILEAPRIPVARGVVRLRPRAIRVTGRFPALLGRGYRLSLQALEPTTFVVRDVSLFERRPASTGAARPISTRLLGSVADARRTAEGRYVESRFSALRLAGRAFAEQPVRGLGVDRFAAFAASHGRFGALPTHNAYAQVAAELGLVGAVLLALTVAVVALALVRTPERGAVRAAVAGAVVVGAVNLLFVNGLASPGAAMPFALAVGLACALAGPRPGGPRAADQREAASDARRPWSRGFRRSARR